jgi:hypothetical protein
MMRRSHGNGFSEGSISICYSLIQVRYFLSRREPPLKAILLIESGSRSLIEGILPHLRSVWGEEIAIDLVTCYAGLPAGFPPGTRVYRVTDYPTPASRQDLVRVLREREYTVAGMVCSAEPIMTRWKWMIALRLPAKFFVLNENGDYFWLHRDNLGTIREFSLVRAGLSGAGAIRTVGRLLLFPFSVLFLLLYAFAAHAGRLVRGIISPAKL